MGRDFFRTVPSLAQPLPPIAHTLSRTLYTTLHTWHTWSRTCITRSLSRPEVMSPRSSPVDTPPCRGACVRCGMTAREFR